MKNYKVFLGALLLSISLGGAGQTIDVEIGYTGPALTGRLPDLPHPALDLIVGRRHLDPGVQINGRGLENSTTNRVSLGTKTISEKDGKIPILTFQLRGKWDDATNLQPCTNGVDIPVKKDGQPLISLTFNTTASIDPTLPRYVATCSVTPGYKHK
jgi:hypothetical protein